MTKTLADCRPDEQRLLAAFRVMNPEQKDCFFTFTRIVADKVKAPAGYLDDFIRLFPKMKGSPEFEKVKAAVINS